MLSRFQEYLRDPTTSITDADEELREFKAAIVQNECDDEMDEFNALVASTIDASREQAQLAEDAPMVLARAIQKRMREENEEVATVKPATPVMAGFTFRPKKKAREELMTIEEMRRLRE